ncbi:MAG: hypothetical protein ACRDMV_04925 [Streptosporangiales bacterium]
MSDQWRYDEAEIDGGFCGCEYPRLWPPRWREYDALDRWDPSIPPGGVVCTECDMPVESEPCAEHQPVAYARCRGEVAS